MLGKLDTWARNQQAGNPDIKLACEHRNEAYDQMFGDTRAAFDLGLETEEMRERYGRSDFGQSCLVARRLIERGVRHVTINSRKWDTHKQHFQLMNKMLPDLDQGLATLLQDLSDRGLLDDTIVWCSGEFGRTPKVMKEAPWNGGRGHYGKVFSGLIAGGGFQGGQVVGASDAKGELVAERAIYPWDLVSSIYTKLGIDPNGGLTHPQLGLVPMRPTSPDSVTMGGMLTEIM